MKVIKFRWTFINFLLNKMGFKTSDTAYFLVVNANRNASGFHGNMEFSETLVPYKHDISWIDEQVQNMIKLFK